MAKFASGVAGYDASLADNHRLLGDQIDGEIAIHVFLEASETNVTVVTDGVRLSTAEMAEMKCREISEVQICYSIHYAVSYIM